MTKNLITKTAKNFAKENNYKFSETKADDISIFYFQNKKHRFTSLQFFSSAKRFAKIAKKHLSKKDVEKIIVGGTLNILKEDEKRTN